MSSPLLNTKDWVIQHKWWAALIIVAVLGYAFGKDMALRDNAADRVQAGESS